MGAPGVVTWAACSLARQYRAPTGDDGPVDRQPSKLPSWKRAPHSPPTTLRALASTTGRHKKQTNAFVSSRLVTWRTARRGKDYNFTDCAPPRGFCSEKRAPDGTSAGDTRCPGAGTAPPWDSVWGTGPRQRSGWLPPRPKRTRKFQSKLLWSATDALYYIACTHDQHRNYGAHGAGGRSTRSRPSVLSQALEHHGQEQVENSRHRVHRSAAAKHNQTMNTRIKFL